MLLSLILILPSNSTLEVLSWDSSSWILEFKVLILISFSCELWEFMELDWLNCWEEEEAEALNLASRSAILVLRVETCLSYASVFPETLTLTELWVLNPLIWVWSSTILFSRVSMILSLSSTPWTLGLSVCHLMYFSLSLAFSVSRALKAPWVLIKTSLSRFPAYFISWGSR